MHGTMAIFNAWCDRVPILVFTASAGPVEERRPGIEWMPTVQDGAAMVRDITKWDDYPWSLQGFAGVSSVPLGPERVGKSPQPPRPRPGK